MLSAGFNPPIKPITAFGYILDASLFTAQRHSIRVSADYYPKTQLKDAFMESCGMHQPVIGF